MQMWGGWDEVLAETSNRGWAKTFILNPFVRSSISGKRLFLRWAYRQSQEYFSEGMTYAYYKTFYLSKKEYVWRVLKDEH